MGIFDKIERSIGGAVDGAFARAFKGEVQPVEIASRLSRELDSEAKLMSRGKKLVPNEFIVGLSTRDFERLTPYTKTLNQEIIPELREHAAAQSYVFNGPIAIHYDCDESLPTGRFTVESHAVAGVDGAGASDTAIRRADLVLEVNGIRHPLTPPGFTIGRGTDTDIRINDPGISRHHAEIRVSGTGSDQVIEIVDMGSTNGIVVNGNKVDHAILGSGSRIELGTTRMLVHSPTEE